MTRSLPPSASFRKTALALFAGALLLAIRSNGAEPPASSASASLKDDSELVALVGGEEMAALAENGSLEMLVAEAFPRERFDSALSLGRAIPFSSNGGISIILL